jgi:hypothetical protein
MSRGQAASPRKIVNGPLAGIVEDHDAQATSCCAGVPSSGSCDAKSYAPERGRRSTRSERSGRLSDDGGMIEGWSLRISEIEARPD